MFQWGCWDVSVALQFALTHSHGQPGSVHEASAAAHASYPHAQSLYGEDVHEVAVKEGLAPPVQLSLRESNKAKLKSFCDTPGKSWDPYQAVECKGEGVGAREGHREGVGNGVRENGA